MSATAAPQHQLFEYAIVLQPKVNKDGEIVEPAKLIQPRTEILAPDVTQAQIMAYRAIPEEYTLNGKLDRIQVAMRPF